MIITFLPILFGGSGGAKSRGIFGKIVVCMGKIICTFVLHFSKSSDTMVKVTMVEVAKLFFPFKYRKTSEYCIFTKLNIAHPYGE